MRTISLTIVSIITLALLATFGLPIFTDVTLSQSVRAVFGTLFIVFIPGFTWSFLLKNVLHHPNDVIGRLIASVGLSAALVPLTLFFGNKIGITLTTSNIIIEVIALSSLALVLVVIRRSRQPHQ